MGGTREGGQAAAKTNKKRYGADYYRYIGQIGGRKSGTGGFYNNRELARRAGQLGGFASRRTGVRNGTSARRKRQREFNRVYKHLLHIGDRARKRREREAKLKA